MRKDYESELLGTIREIVCIENTGGVQNAPERTEKLKILAKRHQVDHFVSYAYYSKGDAEATNDFFGSVAFTVDQMAAVETISEALSKARIKHIMLKGAVIRSLYPEAWMRNSCDIDVLVNEDELDMAGDVLTSLGFERQSIQTLHDISYYKDNINIELHYRLIEDYRLTSGSEILCNVWEYASAGDGEYSFTLADEFFYFYHLAHMAKHYGNGGCGIRSLLDLWILNHRCEFDREARERLIKAGELDRFEGRMKMLAEYWFSDGDGDGLEYIEGYVLQGGVYGNSDNALAVQKGRMGRGGYLIYRFFPPANELVGRFPVLKNHKILLPVFWVVRWWRALFKEDVNHVARLKDEMVKTGEEREIQKMISELGIENFR